MSQPAINSPNPILDESAEAPPLAVKFCQQVSAKDYEKDSVFTTESAVEDLVSFLDRQPEIYKQLLKKRKYDALENAGVLSSLKVKLLSILHGNKYKDISDEEFMEKFTDLKAGLLMALNNMKEMPGRRYSKRFAAKKSQRAKCDSQQLTSTPLPSSAPISVPLPLSGQVLTRPPLRQRNSPVASPSLSTTMKPTKSKRSKQWSFKWRSMPIIKNIFSMFKVSRRQEIEDSFNEKTMASVHRELLRSNPHYWHRTAFHKGTPGRTPYKHKKHSRTTDSESTLKTFNMSTMSIEDSLHQAFDAIIQKKFAEPESPSPATSPSSAAGFQPSSDDSTSVIEWEV